jgi:hypothetical protein
LFLSGNLLLIGNTGTHLTSLIKLAFYLAEIQLHPVDDKKISNFYDSMRAAVRSCGSENKMIGLTFSVIIIQISKNFKKPITNFHLKSVKILFEMNI